MKKKLSSGVLAAVFAIALVVVPVLAAYSADIVVIESGGTTYPMLSCNASMNIDYMATEGYIGSTGLDTRILSGTTPQPHMLADDKLFFSIPVNANSSQTLQFTTGSSNLSAFAIIPGYGGYITIADNTTIELGDNFTFEATGWINTDNGTDKNLIDKTNAFRVYVSPTVSENITADILSTGASENQTLRPDGDGDNCTIPLENGCGACPAHYLCVDEVVPDGDTTAVRVATAETFFDLYTVADNITGSGTINSVTVLINAKDAAGPGFGTPILKTGGTIYKGTETALGLAYALVPYIWATNPNTSANWTWAEIIDLQIGVELRDAISYCTQVYVSVDFSPPVVEAQVSAIGVASGEHSASVSASSLLWMPDYILNGDGTSNSFIAYGDIYSNEGQFWASCWIKLDATTVGLPTVYIWAKGTSSANTVNLQITSGRARFYMRHGGTTYFDLFPAALNWDANTWHHILVSSDNISNVSRIVVDGGTHIATGTSANTTPPTGNFEILDVPYASGNGIDGAVANFVVGTDNLTLAEEAALYANTFPGDETDLWYIDEGVGKIITSYGTASNNSIDAGNNIVWSHETRPCKFGISIDGTPIEGFARIVTVPDNSANWVMMQNNITDFFSYADNFTMEIDGVPQLWFEPNAYIVGTTLPDRQGGNNPGTFTWGGNPAGVGITLGSLISGYVPTYVAPSLETPDVVPEIIEDSSLYITDLEVEAAIATDPIAAWWDTWVTATGVSGIGIDIKIMYWVAVLVVAILGFAFAYKYSNNLLIAGIVAIAIFGFGVARGVFPFWLIIIMVFLLLGLVSMERRTQL